MGGFESYAFGADVELSHRDLGCSDEDVAVADAEEWDVLWGRLEKAVLDRLTEQVTEEIQDSVEITSNQKTFLLRNFGAPEKTVRKTTKRRRRNA
jgi:hypothetical protein